MVKYDNRGLSPQSPCTDSNQFTMYTASICESSRRRSANHYQFVVRPRHDQNKKFSPCWEFLTIALVHHKPFPTRHPQQRGVSESFVQQLNICLLGMDPLGRNIGMVVVASNSDHLGLDGVTLLRSEGIMKMKILIIKTIFFPRRRSMFLIGIPVAMVTIGHCCRCQETAK